VIKIERFKNNEISSHKMSGELTLDGVSTLAEKVLEWEFKREVEASTSSDDKIVPEGFSRYITESATGEVEGTSGLVVHLSHSYEYTDPTNALARGREISSIHVTQNNAPLPHSHSFSRTKNPDEYSRIRRLYDDKLGQTVEKGLVAARTVLDKA